MKHQVVSRPAHQYTSRFDHWNDVALIMATGTHNNYSDLATDSPGRQRTSLMFALFAFFIVLSFVSGCGQKGSLYLPPPAEQSDPASDPDKP